MSAAAVATGAVAQVKLAYVQVKDQLGAMDDAAAVHAAMGGAASSGDMLVISAAMDGRCGVGVAAPEPADAAGATTEERRLKEEEEAKLPASDAKEDDFKLGEVSTGTNGEGMRTVLVERALTDRRAELAEKERQRLKDDAEAVGRAAQVVVPKVDKPHKLKGEELTQLMGELAYQRALLKGQPPEPAREAAVKLAGGRVKKGLRDARKDVQPEQGWQAHELRQACKERKLDMSGLTPVLRERLRMKLSQSLASQYHAGTALLRSFQRERREQQQQAVAEQLRRRVARKDGDTKEGAMDLDGDESFSDGTKKALEEATGGEDIAATIAAAKA
eukprot:gene31394-58221_t